MSASWDLFVDEVKDGGKIKHLGIMFLEAGVSEQLQQHLLTEKNRLCGKGVKVGEVHWSQLTEIEAQLAEKWLDIFLGGPMMFFVRVDPPSRSGTQDKCDLLSDLMAFIESSGRVLGGFERSSAVVHMDMDEGDGSSVTAYLRRQVGVSRASRWESRGSLLLQLSDLLLGVSVADSEGWFPVRQEIPLSQAKARQASLVQFIRDWANRPRRMNAIVVLKGGHEQFLFKMPGT